MTDFIAEVSSNHNQNLDRSLKFVDEAARIGCAAVKFQLFRVRELFASEVLERRADLRERVKWELPVQFLPTLSNRAHERGIKFGCTPFYLEAVDELLPHVDFYKVASYELLWVDLLKRCASTGKPIILSTGMATMPEIEHSFKVLMSEGAKDITLLHCTSGYPTPHEQCNLAAIDTLRKEFGCKVGWSDHSVSEAVILRAIHKFGASTIEFHLDLDEGGVEFKMGHNWLPNHMKHVIETVGQGFESDGSGIKEPVQVEIPDREWRADPSDGLRPFKHIREQYVASHPKK